MTATRRAPARKPAAPKTTPSPTAPKVIVKPTPVDAADAAVGRKLRELVEWSLQVLVWCVSGLLGIYLYRTFPTGGVWGAVLMDGTIGLVLWLTIWRWSR